MKQKFEIKKENRSIIWKVLLVLIYFSFYAVSIRLVVNYLPFINEWLITMIGLFIYFIIILPLVFTPKWYISNDSILIETWEYFVLKKGVHEIKYSTIDNITITYEKVSAQFIYNEAYNILFKVCLKSGDEIVFDSLLGVDKYNYLRGIDFKDKYHILSVLKDDKINLWKHLRNVEEGILND